jgi:hypothetical protein
LSIHDVPNADLDFIETVKDVELGKVEGIVAIDETGMFKNHQVKPATSSTPSCSRAVFGAYFL